MTTGEFSANYDPRQQAHELLDRSQEALRTAVAIVSPENPTAIPQEVFPKPTEVRDDDPGLSLSPEQETALRGAAAELGFGREQDRSVSEMGLNGSHVIIEGGQIHKMAAEVAALAADKDANPTSLIIAATPHRVVTPAETEIASRVLGIEADQVAVNEYLAARQVAALIPGFETSPDQVIPVAYADDLGDYTVSKRESGQLVTIGYAKGVPVNLLRIDRRFYEEAGKRRYKQPGTAELIRIIDGGLEVLRDDDQEPDACPIAVITGGTYQCSREVGAIQASLTTGRRTGVATYGTRQLALTRREEDSLAHINQLPAELRKIADEVAKLEKVLA